MDKDSGLIYGELKHRCTHWKMMKSSSKEMKGSFSGYKRLLYIHIRSHILAENGIYQL